MTPLPILLADVFLGAGDFFSKIVQGEHFFPYSCLDVRDVWAKSMHLKYADTSGIVFHENKKLGDNTPEKWEAFSCKHETSDEL